MSASLQDTAVYWPPKKSPAKMFATTEIFRALSGPIILEAFKEDIMELSPMVNLLLLLFLGEHPSKLNMQPACRKLLVAMKATRKFLKAFDAARH
ncbi:hypothetical protein BT69DRAFT_1344567 [Atractiella rhizophila]|nr:hypothetical protein BT69DRAFT_1344567 [Atractiella rhizophila]